MHDIWIQKSKTHPLQGFAGGASGHGNYGIVYYNTPKAQRVNGHFIGPVEENEIVFMQSGGGGGWGSPLDRDPKLVLEDIANDIISVQGAREEYGVVVEPSGSKVDDVASQKLRQELKKRV
jgi:N-methylhydantoinase B